jgi:hypothetical protein
MPDRSRNRYTISAEIWRYPGKGGWHFVTLPAEQSSEIRAIFAAAANAWGSLPVVATIDGTQWRTSMFPDAKSRCYQSPIKAEARKREKVGVGDTVACVIEVSG